MLADAVGGFLRIGLFVGGCGFLMLLFQPPGSAQAVLSLCSGLMGAALVIGSVAVLLSNRRAETRAEARRAMQGPSNFAEDA